MFGISTYAQILTGLTLTVATSTITEGGYATGHGYALSGVLGNSGTYGSINPSTYTFGGFQISAMSQMFGSGSEEFTVALSGSAAGAVWSFSITDDTSTVYTFSSSGATPVVTGGNTLWIFSSTIALTVGHTYTINVITGGTGGGVGTSPIRGMWDMNGITYVVIGSGLYTMTAGLFTLIASGIGGTGFVRMTDNTACLVILIPSTAICYTYTVANGLQQLLDSTFLFYGAIDCWFLDSYIIFLALNGLEFFNDDGQAVSGQGQITFTTGGVFVREFGTDPFVGMCVDHRTALMFGRRTSEGYVNAGNATESPFSSAPDTYMQIGMFPTTPYAIALQDQSVLWLANDLTVRRRNGQTPIRVSNSGIEAILEANKTQLTGAYAMAPTIGGHPLWVLTIPLIQRTLVYDCLTTEWFELESLSATQGSLAWRPLCYYNAQGLQLVGDSQASQVGYLDASTYAEFGSPMRARGFTQSVYDNHNRLNHRRLEAVITAGGSTSLTAGAQLTMFASDDAGSIYRPLSPKNLGAEGKRSTRAVWFNLGQSRDRAYEWQLSDPTPLFTVALTAEIEGGRF